MKSYMAKKKDVNPAWHEIDADGKILGRMAVKIAEILMGKTKPMYTPHVDTGDYVIVINAAKVQVSGKKAQMKEYQRYSGYPGGQKITSFEDMMAKRPEEVIRLAVKRMLPKNKLGTVMLKKLKIVAGAEHDHSAQQPVKMEL